MTRDSKTSVHHTTCRRKATKCEWVGRKCGWKSFNQSIVNPDRLLLGDAIAALRRIKSWRTHFYFIKYHRNVCRRISVIIIENLFIFTVLPYCAFHAKSVSGHESQLKKYTNVWSDLTVKIYRQTGRLGTEFHSLETQIKCFFQLGVSGNGQDESQKLKWNFSLHPSLLGNYVPVHSACP